jgi:hypothetical protein
MQGFEVVSTLALCLSLRSNAELKATSQDASRLAAHSHRARIAFSDVLDSAIDLVLDLQGSRAGKPVYGSGLGSHFLTSFFLNSRCTMVWLSLCAIVLQSYSASDTWRHIGYSWLVARFTLSRPGEASPPNHVASRAALGEV